MSSREALPADEQQDALKALLINEEGDLTDELEAALRIIFTRFSTSYKQSASTSAPTKADVLTAEDLDAFAQATNGAPFPQEAKQEIQEFLDTDDDGNLTFAGFCEMFHLQSDNEPEETWKDLKKLGFNDKLELVDEQRSKERTEEKETTE